VRCKGTAGRTRVIRRTHTPGEYDWEEKNYCREPEEHVSLIRQDRYALHKCVCFGARLGPALFLGPTVG